MKNNMSSNIPIRSQSSIAVTSDTVSYGVAAGSYAPALPVETAESSLTWAEQLAFFYHEYAKGVLFITLSAIFIFLVPAALSKSGGLKVVLGRMTKRCVDIVGALVGLVLTLPFWLILPILIKLESPGQVFYTQLRVGSQRRKSQRRFCQESDVDEDRRGRDRRRNNYLGTPFTLIKFRTMINDAEKKCGPVWATRNDPRVTRIGSFLRMTRLDEIPQFINVLVGDMSLVGPRPERPAFVAELTTKVDDYADRLEMKPGLTGLAQVTNGYDSSLASVNRKVQLDLEYIRNWSLWADFKILARTVIVVLTGKGAR
ncbi:MAG: sugar transferase [Candidatus Zixiibacteriota bacterium]